ncbi:hypothetical protein BDD43_1726 [Mucilaginibacter gracilis]|uniref:Uncharacterized protein n=1 Tax=Mucilaginibacter gracilis TaxID=423350 RepID=A0A495IY02_9SPHI|nr:hypothetical protein [Mucilaginibacter gracilis]RKR81577.1 hypothetical protein BDD43_1726 [Mucilaginibacter gracilis]
MSTDFKALWNNEGSRLPDIQEIFAKANKLNRNIRRKLWRENVVLPLTAIFIIWIWWYYQPQMITTKIGIVMIVIAIIAFLIATNQLCPLLTDGNAETDSRQFLTQMIKIRQKQDFISSTMTRVYFTLLSTGLALYMIEYALMGGMVFRITYYTLTFAWIAFCWFYWLPRKVKKRKKANNEVIARLEELNGQLGKE